MDAGGVAAVAEEERVVLALVLTAAHPARHVGVVTRGGGGGA
jgi:hypothetical protein